MGLDGQRVWFPTHIARATRLRKALWERTETAGRGRGPSLAPHSPAPCSCHLLRLGQGPVGPWVDPTCLVLLVNSR